MTKATVDGDARPAGSEPQNGAEAAADAVDKLGAMAVADEPQADDQADEAGAADQDAAEQGEADEAATGDEAAESEDDAAGEGDEPEAGEHRSPRAERRIAELTAKTKQAESKLADAEKRVADVEAVAAQSIGLHPDYVSEAEAKLIARARTLQTREKELLKGWDGIDHTDPGKSLTAEQVRTEWAEVRAELDDLNPRARSLYDNKLREMIEDMKVGRKLRLERTAVIQKRGAPDAKARSQVKPPVATKGSATGQRVTSTRGPSGPNAERFRKAGATREAAVNELAMLAGAD